MAVPRQKMTRKEFERHIEQMGAALRGRIEAEVDGFAPDAAASTKRRARAKDDMEFFARTYFPHYIDAANSQLHEYIYRRLPKMARDPRGRRLAVAAPRGEAKSTLVSQIGVLWLLAAELKHFVILVMDVREQAVEMLTAIKAELEVNPRLAMDFPELAGTGPVWKEGTLVTRTGRRVLALGARQRIRGKRHGPHRPDCIIYDDMENDENVESPDQRNKLWKWLTRAALKAGRNDGGTDHFYIGTFLHYDAVLARVHESAAWASVIFSAIVKWPERMDLWEKFEEVYLNTPGEPEDKEDAARAFYEANREAMDRGAVVSWPDRRPLVDLMLIRVEDGHEAFEQEYQNNPLDEDNTTFRDLRYWVVPLRTWVLFGACDPSLGKESKRGDPSAILVGGYDVEHGVLDVIEASIRKRLPSVIISDVITFQQQYPDILRWAVEAVAFQEFLRQEMVKKAAALGVHVPALAFPGEFPGWEGRHYPEKDLRIESLQPHTSNGLIRFNPNHTTLLTQLRRWPKTDHDDGPDALYMLWQAATTIRRRQPGTSEYRSLSRRRLAARGRARRVRA